MFVYVNSEYGNAYCSSGKYYQRGSCQQAKWCNSTGVSFCCYMMGAYMTICSDGGRNVMGKRSTVYNVFANSYVSGTMY